MLVEQDSKSVLSCSQRYSSIIPIISFPSFPFFLLLISVERSRDSDRIVELNAIVMHSLCVLKPINIFQTYLQAMHKRHPAVPSFFSFLSMTPAIFWGCICFGSITLPIRFQGQLIFHHYESDSMSQPFLVANSYHSINCQLLGAA